MPKVPVKFRVLGVPRVPDTFGVHGVPRVLVPFTMMNLKKKIWGA